MSLHMLTEYVLLLRFLWINCWRGIYCDCFRIILTYYFCVELASVIVSSLNSISLLLRLEMHLRDNLWMRRLWLHLWYLVVSFLYMCLWLCWRCFHLWNLMFRCKMIGRFSMVLPYVLNTIIIKSLGKLFSISNWFIQFCL